MKKMSFAVAALLGLLSAPARADDDVKSLVEGFYGTCLATGPDFERTELPQSCLTGRSCRRKS
jgi:hypothetical protein